MSYEIKGEIIKIGETETFPSGFQKRNIVIRTLENYPQEILIEFMKDKVDLPDVHSVGAIVTVGININGRMWESPTGEKKWFNTIVGWKMIKEATGATEVEPIQAKPEEKPRTIEKEIFEEEDDDLPF